jgi:hypothetical protein
MMLDRLGSGRVVSVDLNPRPGRPVHARIEYVTASSTDPAVVARLRRQARGKRVLVILDSDHRAAHVYNELIAYSPLVGADGYFIVEDTIVNRHPVWPDFGPGPMEGLQTFLAQSDAFESDPRCERFLVTLNPKGYLRRKPGRGAPAHSAPRFGGSLPPSDGIYFDHFGGHAATALYGTRGPFVVDGPVIRAVGWGHAPHAAELFITLEPADGGEERVFCAGSRVERPDVAAARPHCPASCGFDVLLDIEDVSPGAYRLGVLQRAADATYRDRTEITLQVR